MRDRPSDTHRTVLGRVLGRPLDPSEVVDHLDEDKANNSPLNLQVTTRSAHTTKHAATRTLGRLKKALTMVHRGEKLY